MKYLIAIFKDQESKFEPVCICNSFQEAVSALADRFQKPPFMLKYVICHLDPKDFIHVHFDGDKLLLD